MKTYFKFPYPYIHLVKYEEHSHAQLYIGKGVNHFLLFKEKAGVISPESCWCIIQGGYLYVHDTLPQVLWQFVTEHKHDKYMVG